MEYSTNANHNQAEAAIRAIGTNALPVLLYDLQGTESPKIGRAKRVVEGSLNRRIISEADRASLALGGFSVLGTNAVGVIPDLIGLFRNADPYLGGHDPAYQAARALKKIGTPSIPALVAATTNENEMVRVHSCFALADLGASQAVPALIKRLNDPSRIVRIRAALAIGNLHPAEAEAIAALAGALKDSDSAVRASAAIALSLCGSQAAAAVTKLRHALQEELKRPPMQTSKGGIFEEKSPGEVAAAIRAALLQIGPASNDAP